MDPDVHEEVSRVREKVMDLELSTTKKLGDIEATVRVSKHETANLQQMVAGVNTRIDRFEVKFSSDLKEINDTLQRELRSISKQVTQELEKLSGEMTTEKVNRAKGAGFYAGIMAAVTAGGGVLMFLGKLLFGGHT